MLSQPPEITTPADDPRPEFGAPVRTRHSPESDTQDRPYGGPAATRTTGRHRRVGVEPADKFLLDIPTPHRPTTLADSPPTYRAAFLTDDMPWSRPSVSDEMPRYRASRAAETIPQQHRPLPQQHQGGPQQHPAAPPADPPSRSRRQAAPGRRRAQQDNAWDKATGAVQRAATGLTRRAGPPTHPDRPVPDPITPHPAVPDPAVPHPAVPHPTVPEQRRPEPTFFDPDFADHAGYDRTDHDRADYDRADHDRADYDRAGDHRVGLTEFDRTEFDRAGYDRAGYDNAAYDWVGHERVGRERVGPDAAVLDPVDYDAADTEPSDRGRAAARARAIVVRPLPLNRDALAEQSQAARRVAGAVRDWTLAGTDARPVTGSRRAPGTLPIENWLLIGRHRQQALLAALVAVGIALVMIPNGQDTDEVTTVNAADRSVATGPQGRAGDRKPGALPAGAADAAEAAEAAHRDTPDDKPGTAPTAPGQVPAPAPDGAAADVQPPLTDRQPSAAPSSAAPSTPTPGETASGVSPDARGPAQSLRTTGTDTVALTFDDGPDPVQTPKLLEMLATYKVTATFCLVGERAQANPDLVRQIVAAGHTLCNHSWNHSFTLGAQPPAAIRKDLEATDKAIRDAVPDVPIPYFRAPGGIFTDRLVSVADEYQMKSLYWEVDPRDWDHTKDADDAKHIERVVAEVKEGVKPGAIVLSHDFNQPETIAAYEQLLPYLTEKYQLGLP